MTAATMLLSLAEQSHLLFFSYDLTANRFVYFNKAFKDTFELETDKTEPAALLTMMHPEDQEFVRKQLMACIEGKAVTDVECRLVRGNNERYLRIIPYLVANDGERLLMGHAEDITIQKQHSQTLNTHNNKKNSILNILSHDLAGPIGTIQNLSALLHRETAPLQNARINEYVAMVKKISQSCIHLIKDFLNQEFLESSGIQLLKRRVELVEKIKNLTQEYLGMQKDLDLQFVCSANRDVIYVDIDEDKFLQVINNLISNAMKFTRNGGTITLNVEESEKSILVSVADNGIGIPQRFHATLFDKFSNARRKGLRGEHSTGLGMSIIETIVEWHGGKIWFNSEEHKGTTFYIELPKN